MITSLGNTASTHIIDDMKDYHFMREPEQKCSGCGAKDLTLGPSGLVYHMRFEASIVEKDTIWKFWHVIGKSPSSHLEQGHVMYNGDSHTFEKKFLVATVS